jgi:anti-sigma factor RsiW
MGANEHVTCGWVLDRIDPYIDGDLSGEERGTFEEHVEKCGNCGGELELARQVIGELRSLPGHTCPGRVIERAAGEIARYKPEPRRQRLAGWVGERVAFALRPAVAAMIVVIAAAAVFVLTNDDISPFRSHRTGRQVSQVTDQDLEAAKQEVILAFAYVGEASRKTGYVVRDDVIGERVVAPVLKAVATARDVASEHP